MAGFKDVFNEYLATVGLSNGRVPNENTSLALQAIREDIPELLRFWIAEAGVNPADYKVVGSVGQTNFYFANIPWVAIFNRNITTSAQRGYFLVFLFSSDMSSVWLSLNQGYTQFKDRFKSDVVASRQIQGCARTISAQIGTTPFYAGPIDLKAHNDLGRGYELGAILSEKFDASNFDSQQLKADVIRFVKIYDGLYQSGLTSAIDQLAHLDESDFQDVVSELAVALEDEGSGDEPIMPIPSPLKAKTADRAVYKRKAKIAAQALKCAGFRCEGASADESHDFFVSKATRKNYVEAHHFIPFSKQGEFIYSLDVPENIAALCPVCHRKLHHASVAEKTNLIKNLLEKKAAGLALRGLEIDLKQLKTYYSYLGDQD